MRFNHAGILASTLRSACIWICSGLYSVKSEKAAAVLSALCALSFCFSEMYTAQQGPGQSDGMAHTREQGQLHRDVDTTCIMQPRERTYQT